MPETKGTKHDLGWGKRNQLQVGITFIKAPVVNSKLVGYLLGISDGEELEIKLGEIDGHSEGDALGKAVGDVLGDLDGNSELGDAVGTAEGR